MKTDSDLEKNVNSVKDFGVLIRKVRKNLGLSQKEAAGLCGVGTRFLSELENGKESIEAGKLILVLRALGLRLTLSFHSRHTQKWKVSSEESGLVSKLDRGRNQPGDRPTDILHLRPRLSLFNLCIGNCDAHARRDFYRFAGHDLDTCLDILDRFKFISIVEDDLKDASPSKVLYARSEYVYSEASKWKEIAAQYDHLSTKL